MVNEVTFKVRWRIERRIYAAAHGIDPREIDETDGSYQDVCQLIAEYDNEASEALARALGIQEPDEVEDWQIVEEIDRLRKEVDRLRREVEFEHQPEADLDWEITMDRAMHGPKKPVCACVSDDQAAQLGPGFTRPVCAVHPPGWPISTLTGMPCGHGPDSRCVECAEEGGVRPAPLPGTPWAEGGEPE